MQIWKEFTRRSSVLAAALVMMFSVLASSFLNTTPAYAIGQFTNRSVALNSSQIGSNSTDANGTVGTFGEGYNGAKTKYVVSFKISSAAIVNSMAITFCQSPFPQTACNAPAGMATTLTAATVTSGFNTTTGVQMSLDTGTVANTGYFNFGSVPCAGSSPFRANCILLKRATTQSTTNETANATITLGFGTSASNYITNPTTQGTYYARITTFSDNAYTTGNVVDEGVAAFAISSTDIDITSKVQEQLTFSVGITYTAPGSTCAALSGGGSLAIGDGNGALSTSTPYGGRAYWRVYTNASNGTTIQYSADTLKTTTGYSITAAGTSAVTVANGVEKFGFGLDPNDGNQSLGTFDRFPTSAAPDVYGGANSSNINTAAIALDTTSVSAPKDMAKQNTPGPVACSTGSNYYVASASTSTKPGIYKTAFTYIAVPVF